MLRLYQNSDANLKKKSCCLPEDQTRDLSHVSTIQPWSRENLEKSI